MLFGPPVAGFEDKMRVVVDGKNTRAPRRHARYQDDIRRNEENFEPGLTDMRRTNHAALPDPTPRDMVTSIRPRRANVTHATPVFKRRSHSNGLFTKDRMPMSAIIVLRARP